MCMMKQAFLLASFLVSAVHGQACWWTGCQLNAWATVGCAQYNMNQMGQRPCPEGNLYHCCPRGGGDTGGQITQDQFTRACQTRGGNPDPSDYQLYLNALGPAGISGRSESVMFLAHVIWESLGLSAWRELFCQNSANTQACSNAYGVGPTGQIFYGRGPLQLSHEYNYRAASQSIFGNVDQLLNNPDQVASDRSTGWRTASYFWSTNVHSSASTFGGTLKKINGFLECDGGTAGENMWKRCDHYREILGIIGLPLPDRQTDCYCRNT